MMKSSIEELTEAELEGISGGASGGDGRVGQFWDKFGRWGWWQDDPEAPVKTSNTPASGGEPGTHDGMPLSEFSPNWRSGTNVV